MAICKTLNYRARLAGGPHNRRYGHTSILAQRSWRQGRRHNSLRVHLYDIYPDELAQLSGYQYAAHAATLDQCECWLSRKVQEQQLAARS
ncbi:hypothetical protein [Halorhodospira halochloris]|uniref:hypothetical protein n=1 Tax=Halorhodospira halochloris TaxID=1052 RepID=UPI0013A5B527|nr:hypothetical protein [Halorhodospira halochloris]